MVDEANALLDAQLRGDAHSHTSVWLQLHVGAPGAAGTDNVAVNDTRMDASAAFGTVAAGGSNSNDAEIGPWSSVPASETYTHFTLWTGETTGVAFLSGTVTAAAVTAGDPWSVPVGDATVSYAVAA